MKKLIALLLALVMVLAMVACGGKDAPEANAPEVNAPEANAPEADKDYKIVFVGGETSNQWYAATEAGVVAYAKETGVDITFRGMASSDPTEAVSIIKDVTAQKVDAILVGVDCQDAVESALAEAREAGILVIATEGAGMTNIDYDVEPCTANYYGEYMMINLAKMMGEKGSYVIMVGDLTSSAHNAWADAAIAYQKANYPEMTLIEDRLESQQNAEIAYEKAKEILKKYPDLGGIIGCSSLCPLGSAKAVAELGTNTKVFGNGTMLTCEAALKDGTLEAITFWNPGLTAKAMANLAIAVLDGGKEVVVDGMNLGYEEYAAMEMDAEKPHVLYGAGLVYGTIENFDEHPF